jgi:Tfp pilus assembly PilM family ATPase
MAIELIRREYGRYSESDDSVYDYSVLSPKGPRGGVEILAVGVARDLILSYRRTLIGAGFDLKSIDIGIHCQIKLARLLPQLQQGSVILAHLDGRALTLTLFETGNYVVSNRYRLSHADTAPELTDEIGNNISSMIQFNKTQKDSAAITAAYTAGVDDAGIDALRSSLTYLGINVGSLDMSGYISLQADAASELDAGRYLLNIGNLIKR